MTASTTRRPWRQRVPSAGAIAVRLVCFVSAAFSAGYYYGWLPELPVAIYGVEFYAAGAALAGGLALLDLCKSVAVKSAFRLWSEAKWLQAALPVLTAIVLVLVSFFAVDGLLMKLRVGEAGRVQNEQSAWDRADDAYKNAKSEVKRIEGELESFKVIRSTSEIKSEMERVRMSPKIFAWTKECTTFDGKLADFKKTCQPILELRQQMAAAIRKSELEDMLAPAKAQFEEAKSKLDATERPAVADAQAELLGYFIAWVRDDLGDDSKADYSKMVVLGLCWLIGLGVELVSAVGPYWVAHAKQSPAPSWLPSPAETAQTSFPVPETDPPPPGNRKRKATVSNRRSEPKPRQPSATLLAFPGGGNRPSATVSKRRRPEVSEVAALAWLHGEIERNGCLPCQDTMATDLGVHKGTVAKWLKKWEGDGLIVRQPSGRCKVVRMAEVQA